MSAQRFRRSDFAELSPRELQVLAYLSRGLTRKQTADALWLSPETVKSHAATAQLRLGAKNKTQACCEALRRGLIR